MAFGFWDELMKIAASSVSGVGGPIPEAVAAPLPQAQANPGLAPGKRGPNGLAPRTNYTRVNTGTPPPVDAGVSSQKSLMPEMPRPAAVMG